MNQKKSSQKIKGQVSTSLPQLQTRNQRLVKGLAQQLRLLDQNEFVKTEFFAKQEQEDESGRNKGDSYIKTTYRIKSARDQIKQTQSIAEECIQSIQKYYTGHKHVLDCHVQMCEQDDSLSLAVLVFFTPNVLGFRTFGEAIDRMEYIEQLAQHVNFLANHTGTDQQYQQVVEMANIIGARQLVLDQDEASVHQLEHKTSETEMILTEFALLGSLNRMAQMIHTPSPLQAEYLDELDRRHRMSVSSQMSQAVGGHGRCVSVSLEYLGLMSPEQLKCGRQDSLALVWQIGVLLYRIAEQDQHPFLSCLSSLPDASNELQEEQIRNAGFITQTRRNIILIRYKKTKGQDLKSHKLQQLLDKVFCAPLQRMTLGQFVKEIQRNKLSLSVPKSNAYRNRDEEIKHSDQRSDTDFNPQVHILHQSASSKSSHRKLENYQSNQVNLHEPSPSAFGKKMNRSSIMQDDLEQSSFQAERRAGSRLQHQIDSQSVEKLGIHTEDKGLVTQHTISDRGFISRMSEENKKLNSRTVDGDSVTQVDIDQNQYSSVPEGQKIKVNASQASGQSRQLNANNFNEGLKALDQNHKKKQQERSDAGSSIAGGRSRGGSADFDDSSNEMSFEDKRSISSRMLALHQKPQDFYQFTEGSNMPNQLDSLPNEEVKKEDDMAQIEFEKKKPNVQTTNAFEEMAFDDLPSAQSSQKLSQLESISDDNEPLQQYIDTPQKNAIQQISPREQKANLNYSFHSEENSQLGDIEDQIGFVLCLDQDEAIGITIVTCQFLYFNYSNVKTKKSVVKPQKLKVLTSAGQPADQVPQNVMQAVEVKNKDSIQVTYIVVASSHYVDIFSLDKSDGIPQILHQKKMNQVTNTICTNMEQLSQFYIAVKNYIVVATIDLDSEKKVILSEKKLTYSSSSSDRTTALRSTILQSEVIAQQTETESVVAVGFKSADDEHFNLAILKKENDEAEHSLVKTIHDCHTSEITQILALTDFYCKLSFVTMSLDGQIKIFSDKGSIEKQIQGLGSALNGSVMPNKQDYFLVSTQNEETEENFVCVYRRQVLKRQLGPFDCQVLDLKMSSIGNKLFLPNQLFSLERFELKDL